MRSIIYLIINKDNGFKYVGKTTLMMNKEWQAHIEASKKMSKESIHKAFRKFGVHKFTIRELDDCHEKQLEEKYQFWINKYQPEYNDLPKIKPPPKPRPISTNAWGTVIKEEHRGNGKHCGLRIRGTNIETGEVKEWNTVREAAEEITGDPRKNSNILVTARRNGKCYGYKWKLLEQKSKKKAIYGINKLTEENGPEYESIKAACRALGNGCAGTSLKKSLEHPGQYSWKGYYWYYKETKD
jgi:group I intron endonuclease